MIKKSSTTTVFPSPPTVSTMLKVLTVSHQYPDSLHGPSVPLLSLLSMSGFLSCVTREQLCFGLHSSSSFASLLVRSVLEFEYVCMTQREREREREKRGVGVDFNTSSS